MAVPTWPIEAADLRKALGLDPGEGDPDDLGLFALAASEEIDRRTGRDLDPTRHMVGGTLPVIFHLAARETAKLWYQQANNGPRGRPSDPGATSDGVPAGAALPRKVEGWLSQYPPGPLVS